jgi:hypothetical protein
MKILSWEEAKKSKRCETVETLNGFFAGNSFGLKKESYAVHREISLYF